jgi:hypothetical protein
VLEIPEQEDSEKVLEKILEQEQYEDLDISVLQVEEPQGELCLLPLLLLGKWGICSPLLHSPTPNPGPILPQSWLIEG